MLLESMHGLSLFTQHLNMAPCGGGTDMLAESSGKFFLLLRDRQSLSLLLRGVLH